MKKVTLTFKNGTMYFDRNEFYFKKDEFLPENKCFTYFDLEILSEKAKDDSLVREWIQEKFETEEERKFFKMCVADLLITQNNSEILPFFYGEAGRGKTIFLEALQNILKKDTISSLSVNDFNSRFSKVALLKSCINLSSEISRKTVNSDIFKRIISREVIEMEYKGVQSLMGRPLAKHFAVANDIPDIELDSGVDRRFCIVKIKSGFLREHLSKNDYKYQFFDDKLNLLGVIFEGIKLLFENDFDLAGYYQKFVGKEHKQEFVERNDTVAYFINTCFEEDAEGKTGYTATELTNFFNIFSTTTEGTGIYKMKVLTLGKRLADIKSIEKKSVKIEKRVEKKYFGLKLKDEWFTTFTNS